MKQFSCKYCGSTDLFTEKRGSQTALRCGDCGKFNKWLPKDEINVFKYFKQSQKENVLGGWRSILKDPPQKGEDVIFYSKAYDQFGVGYLPTVEEDGVGQLIMLYMEDGIVDTGLADTQFFYWHPLPDAPTEEEMRRLDEE